MCFILIRFGWIPNLTGDLSIDFPEETIVDLFKDSSDYDAKADAFKITRDVSDCDTDKQTLDVIFTIPSEFYSSDDFTSINKIHASFTVKNTPLDVILSVTKKGMVRLEMDEKQISDFLAKKLLFETYLMFKDIFHEHTHHAGTVGHDDADSLLKLSSTEDFEESVKEIADRYVSKIRQYTGELGWLTDVFNNKNEGNSDVAGATFFKVGTLAKGEMIYGIRFAETFKDTIGPSYTIHLESLRAGRDAIDVLDSEIKDFLNYKMNETSNKMSEMNNKINETNMKNGEAVKKLTYCILALTALTIFPLISEYVRNFFHDALMTVYIISFVAAAIIIICIAASLLCNNTNCKCKSNSKNN